MRPTLSSLCQTVAVSVATVLGTGILGLPVALHASGFRPFLFTFTINLVAQIGVVIAMTELLQCAFAKSTYTAISDQENASELRDHGDADIEAPSLHALGANFIKNPSIRFVFNLTVLFHFLFILSTYALAGPQAYAALFPPLRGLPTFVPISVFTVIGTLLVIAATKLLLPWLSLATLVKAVLLTVLVLVTFMRGLVINQHIVNSWELPSLIDPVLMGTMALSGVVNIMPITFQACLNGLPADAGTIVDAPFVRSYRFATITAVLICYFLNVAWSAAVLHVVPQVSEPGIAAAGVASNATLTAAAEMGLISTVPLMQVLQARNDPMDTVISFLVNLFTALSVTISFLIMSIGTKHYIDGEVKSRYENDSQTQQAQARQIRYLLFFSIMLAIALFNPQGLFKIMIGFTALALNLEAGVFIIYMLYTSRDEYAETAPDPLSPLAARLIMVFVGVYYCAAVLIDLFFYIPTIF